MGQFPIVDLEGQKNVQQSGREEGGDGVKEDQRNDRPLTCPVFDVSGLVYGTELMSMKVP